MVVSIGELRRHCHKLIRKVETSGITLEIARQGRIVATLHRCTSRDGLDFEKPWLRLRAMGGRLLASPEESMVRIGDFDALKRRQV